MRGIFWRVLALALASAIAWLLWHWPDTPEPFELELEPDCSASVLQEKEPGVLVCWEGDKRVEFRNQ